MIIKKKQSWRLASAVIVAILAIVIPVFIWLSHQTPVEEAPRVAPVYSDELQKKRIEELQSFIDWLEKNDAKGYIGELGWPKEDEERWAAIADLWYKTVDQHDILTSIWATGSRWGDYSLEVYGAGDDSGVISVANPQASTFEEAVKRAPLKHGINVAGMEFGNPTATNPGTPDKEYFYESEASFTYLMERGVRLIRLPFSWERVQPRLGDQLSNDEVSAIRNILDIAQRHDMKVILDLHNYGAYSTGKTTYRLGESRVLDEALVDVWQKLSDEFSDHQALLGYGLMNEPHDLGSGNDVNAARHWEKVSQQVVTALREKGDESELFVAGYDWASLKKFPSIHQQPWINDSFDKTRYEVHHYWDHDGSGKYIQKYDIVLMRNS